MSPEVTAAVIAASVSVLTLVGTLTAQYLGRRATSRDTQEALEEQRTHLDKTLEAQSDQLKQTLAAQRTRTLNERFATAADRLGSDKPPAVRLAGVYAMAGLADDWEENRQTCVDVLCAYLRIPYEPDPGQDAAADKRLAFQASREVRHTVIRVITARLKGGKDDPMSWQGLNFDFSGVVFDGGDFWDARFSGGTVNFQYAEFSGGVVDFGYTKFSGGDISFRNARFSDGTVNFRDAEFSEGTLDFEGARFVGSTVNFKSARFVGSTVLFMHAQFSRGTVDFSDAHFTGRDRRGKVKLGGIIFFSGAQFSGSTVKFSDALFDGAEVEFGGMGPYRGLYSRFSGDTVEFEQTRFSGGSVDFSGAGFRGGTVDFGESEAESCKFCGGEVDFSRPRDWSCPPKFPWTDTPPSGVKLPRKEDQSQA